MSKSLFNIAADPVLVGLRGGLHLIYARRTPEKPMGVSLNPPTE